jgi:hypothetical protein
VGSYSGATTNNPNCVVEGAAIWNVAMSEIGIDALTKDFFGPVRAPSPLSLLTATFGAAVGGPAGPILFDNDSLSGGLFTLTGGLQ